jgi:uncharacterized protein (TIGR02284 family)
MALMMKDVVDLLNDLIEIDYDAIHAYKAAILRLSDVGDKTQLGQFMADHRRHVSELSLIVRNLGGAPPEHGDLKQVLTKGRVILAGLTGEKAILEAMKTNEDDTNKAYERAVAFPNLPADILPVVQRNLGDERRHRVWLMQRIQTFDSRRPPAPGPVATR